MRERRITTTQVERCLKNGVIIEAPVRAAKGNWKCTMSVLSAGVEVRVALALDRDKRGNRIIIITAMNGG